MKTMKRFFYAMACAVFALASCSDDKNDDYCTFGNQKANFSSSIAQTNASRATGTQWGVDQIGVFMKKAGESLSTGVLSANKRYTTTGDGMFIPANGDETIYYPESGKVDFVAYYPFAAGTTTTVPVDVSNQTNTASFDLLYSNDATEVDKSSNAVALTFYHQLTNLVLNVKDESGASLANLGAVLTDINSQATFSLVDKTFSGATGVKNITPVVTPNGNTAKVSAIILPGANTGASIKFTVDGRTYIWDISDKTFEGESRYTFDINLKGDGDFVVVNPNGTIEDWTDVNGGNVDLEEDGEEPVPGGEEVEFFKETFGATAVASNTNLSVFEDFDMKTVTYTDTYSKLSIRKSGFGNNNVWFPAVSGGIAIESELKIEGIESGYTGMKLTYGIGPNTDNQASAQEMRVFAILSGSEQELAVPDVMLEKANTEQTIENLELPDGTIGLRFFYFTETGQGVRLDNIKIKGTK